MKYCNVMTTPKRTSYSCGLSIHVQRYGQRRSAWAATKCFPPEKANTSHTDQELIWRTKVETRAR